MTAAPATATSAAAAKASPASPPVFAYSVSPLGVDDRRPFGGQYPATHLAHLVLTVYRRRKPEGWPVVPFLFAVMAMVESRRHHRHCPHRSRACTTPRWAQEELLRLADVWATGRPDGHYTWKRMWPISPLDRGASLSDEMPPHAARHILALCDTALAVIEEELYLSHGDTPPCRESFTMSDAEAVRRLSETYSARAAEIADPNRRPAPPAVAPALSPGSPPPPLDAPTTSLPSLSEERPTQPAKSSPPTSASMSSSGENHLSLRAAPPAETAPAPRSTRSPRSTA